MLLLPILIYVILYAPFLGIAPYHDGYTEFRIAYNLFTGHYLSNWISFHPPFKLILASLFFLLFGLNSYTVIGLILGIIGVGVFYFIANNLFNKAVAVWSAIFLATSGIFISNSIFNLTDFIITILILLSFYFY